MRRRRHEARRDALPADVFVPCEVCKGKRYNEATLRVRYRDKSIADVLDTPIAEAREAVRNPPGLSPILGTLCDVGLGYLALGQPAPTLSGGGRSASSCRGSYAGAIQGARSIFWTADYGPAL